MYLRARGDENPRPGFDNGRQPVGQITSAASGLPEGRAKRVNPPRCTRRHRSHCLMAATPYQAYAQISPLASPNISQCQLSCRVQMPDGGCALTGLRNSAFPTIKPAPFRRPDKRERHPAFLSLQILAFPPSIHAVAHTLSEQSSRLKICLTALAQLPIVAPRCPPVWRVTIQCGEVSEWLKEHAWKVCIRQRIGGSNPPLTAII